MQRKQPNRRDLDQALDIARGRKPAGGRSEDRTQRYSGRSHGFDQAALEIGSRIHRLVGVLAPTGRRPDVDAIFEAFDVQLQADPLDGVIRANRRQAVRMAVVTGTSVYFHRAALPVEWACIGVEYTVGEVRTWLHVYGVTHAHIIDPQLLPTDKLADLCNWLATDGITPVLVVLDVLGEAAPICAVQHDVCWMTPAEFEGRWPRDAADVVGAPGPLFPLVPRTDGFRFRSTARSVLTEQDFATVDELLCDEVKRWRTWFADTKFVNGEKILSQRRQRCRDRATLDECLVLLRALQIGAFWAGWHLTVDTDRFCAVASTEVRPGTLAADWDEFDVYPTARVPAIAALYVHGLAVEDIRLLRLTDVVVRPDGLVDVNGAPDSVVLSGAPARFVAAQALARRFAGHGEDMPLFVQTRGTCTGLAMRAQTVALALHAPLPALGIRVAESPVRSRRATATEWARRCEVRVAKMERAAR